MLVPGITATRVISGVASRNVDFVVTEGAQNPSLFFYYGYNDVANGSVGLDIGSIDPTTLDGNAVVFAYWYDFSTGFFYFGVTGDWTATPYALFKSIIPEGAPRLLVKEARLIQYTASRNYTSWEWELPIPAQWDGVGTSLVSTEIDPLVYTITEGIGNNFGTLFYGYNDGGYIIDTIGSIAPIGTIDGVVIKTATWDQFAGDAFALCIAGDWTLTPNVFFEGVQPEGSEILRADAVDLVNYNSINDYTLWLWEDKATTPVTFPPQWDGSGSSELTIYRPGHFVEPETKTFTITQGVWLSGFNRGYLYTDGGSRSPLNFNEGTVLLGAYYSNFSPDYPINITVKGLKAETWLTSVTPQGGGTYTPAAGSWSQSGALGTTSWQCYSSSAALGTTWDGVGDVTIDITIDPGAV